MESTNKDESTSSPTSPAGKSSSRSSKRNNERTRDSYSKAKEKSRRARDSPATTLGAVPSSSNRLERKKESGSGSKISSSASGVEKSSGGQKSRTSSSGASKPGAVPSTGRGSRKGSSSRPSDNNKSSHRHSSKASSGSSATTRSPRPNDEKPAYRTRNAPDRAPSVALPSPNDMESGIVAGRASVDETAEMQTTTIHALRQVEAFRQELQRTRQQQAASRSQEAVSRQASESRRRKMPLWGKVCLGSLILIGAAIIATAIALGRGDGSSDETAIPGATLVPSAEPTEQATTVAPTGSPSDSPTNTGRPDGGQTVFDPPSARTCSKISDGLPVDGQEDMTKQTLSIKLNVYLLLDINKEVWLPSMLQNIQQLLMPPVVGCGNTALDLFPVGNAQVDQNNATLVSCEDPTNRPCYTVEFPVNIFLQKDLASYDLDELNQHVEGIFKTSTSLAVDAQDENSKAISDIGSVTSVSVTPSPSQQPSSKLMVSSNPSSSPSLQPTVSQSPTLAPVAIPTLQPTSLPTIQPTVPPSPLPTPGPTSPPSPLPTPRPSPPPTPRPTPGPTLAPTPSPTSSPSRAPSPNPTQQPSAAPTSKCMRVEATLSRFTPFEGNDNKRLALNWLCSNDTWEPPSSATDETSQSLWEERFALAVFYYATNGDDWTNNNGWFGAASVCTWTGINGCDGDDLVTKIELYQSDGSSYGLVGDFPDEMRALTNLEHVGFGWNRYLSGRIPSFLPELTKLTYLGLADTGRIGSIPSELFAMTQLRHLWLGGNLLTGSIPSGIGAMTELRNLGAEFNDLTGSLPDGFDRTQLTALSLNENYLNGTIPPLPSSLTGCWLALEQNPGDQRHFVTRKTEGNCFTDTTNAPAVCRLDTNCP